MAVSTAFPGQFDRHLISFCTPLSRNFPRNAFSRFGDLITSEIKILRPPTSSSTLLIAFRHVSRCLFAGCMVTGEQRPNPSFSCLRFVPSNTQILLSRDWLEESSCTVFGVLRHFHLSDPCRRLFLSLLGL